MEGYNGLAVADLGTPDLHYSYASIAPEFIDMSIEQEILVTGIKVVDLLAPYPKGGKSVSGHAPTLTVLTIPISL